MNNIFAGVALERIEEGAPFFCTRFSDGNGHLYIIRPFVPSPPTEHRLSVTRPKKFISSISKEIGLRLCPPNETFILSYPIAIPPEQWVAVGAAGRKFHDHCTAFLSGCEFDIAKTEDIVECLFIDLTPGQVASLVKRGIIDQGQWEFREDGGKIVLGDIDRLSAHEVFEKLVDPIVSKLSALLCVGILRPDGAFPELSSIRVELQFVNTPVKWLSLADLSYGSAVSMHRHLDIFSRKEFRPRNFTSTFSLFQVAWGIQLADGRIINIVPSEDTTPAKSCYYFTTSKDYQSTATLRFVRGTIPCSNVLVDGLTSRLRGATRIKVTLVLDIFSGAEVTVQELASNLNIVRTLPNPEIGELERSHSDAHKNQHGKATFGLDGVVGELPE